MEDMMRNLDGKAMADLITTLWNCWNSRNQLVFKGKIDSPLSIWEKARTLSNDFQIYNLVNPPILAQNEDTKKWERPTKNTLKINFDATVKDNRMGYGFIIRDDDGFVLGGGGGFKDGRVSIQEAKCIALERSIDGAIKLDLLGEVTFETDNAGLVNILNRGMKTSLSLAVELKGAKELLNYF
ncbi:Transcription factor TFIIIB component B'' [Gossypium australe]|uniref:Transcription factor TFIIIB component B n=1 Tax=Gossypium australe TaxID=47621 RepID=A0A5B6UL31_9ROSI|nr:Transcription factor TFIIIB component B'' [Gossypium australe]